ncbi:MAG: helix-turn-helix domain-containing protein [Acidobacteria bacterium]|nr:helix-turn-helix domain-containing protein [Acidobacteriota bacterium]
MRSKDFAVLRHLITQRGQLVTKAALLGVAWPDVFVTDAVLKVSIRRLRVPRGVRDARPARRAGPARRRQGVTYDHRPGQQPPSSEPEYGRSECD